MREPSGAVSSRIVTSAKPSATALIHVECEAGARIRGRPPALRQSFPHSFGERPPNKAPSAPSNTRSAVPTALPPNRTTAPPQTHIDLLPTPGVLGVLIVLFDLFSTDAVMVAGESLGTGLLQVLLWIVVVAIAPLVWSF